MKKNGSVGFTLIELMVTISVAGVLLAIAIPGFNNMIINNRIAAVANDVVTSLAVARSEAIKRGMSVRISSMSSSSNFALGWSVWVDSNGNGTRDAGETLRVHEALKTGFALDSSSFTTLNEIKYFPSGTTDSQGSLKLCFSGYKGRLISVGPTGRVSSGEATCS